MSIYLHVFAKKQLKLGNLITIKKTSYYGFVLRSKQLLRFFYCFTDERHFANFYFLSLRLIKRRKLADSFVGLLESRLDVLLFRSYFSSSVLESRSLILNGFVFIKKKRSFFFNGVRNINFLLQPGSLVWVTSLSLSFLNTNLGFIIPFYLDVCFSKCLFVFLFRPHLKDVYYHFVINEVPLVEIKKKIKSKKKFKPHNFETRWFDFVTFELRMKSSLVFGKKDCCFVDKYKLFNLVLEFYSRSI